MSDPGRDIGRIGDMGPETSLRVGFDEDGDVYVAVADDTGMAGVEFCTCGQCGGKSPNTRAALIELMKAMKQDNDKDPSRNWWKAREADNGQDA